MSSHQHHIRGRILREIADCNNDETSDVRIEYIDSDESPFHLKGSFSGPEGTPYEGGRFEVEIFIPESWPFCAPKVKSITKVYHPSFSSTSDAICLGIFGNDWSPILTMGSMLISLQSILSSPDASDPEDAEVAKHYLTDRNSFNDTAARWTQIYAGGPGPGGTTKSTAPGVPNEDAITGLEETHRPI